MDFVTHKDQKKHINMGFKPVVTSRTSFLMINIIMIAFLLPPGQGGTDKPASHPLAPPKPPLPTLQADQFQDLQLQLGSQENPIDLLGLSSE
jgi:hypothetical protein